MALGLLPDENGLYRIDDRTGLLPDENGLYRIDDMTGDMMLTKEQMLRNYGMKIKLPLVTSYIVVLILLNVSYFTL